ncbi:DMT family transporter [Pseudonocardia acidicola]|uniref:DMT family transporter n=1 Tax=Pseudonocardia acidicola TaxID=2724939 RepID=A0ABX1SBC5_9PSEU|nr:DMT family transporter [Pseudonocardia acidicola]NMH98400.1 DMT family transporter [Pseudonocardia acidicola]
MIGILLAIGAALSNALGTVFQRKAAQQAPPEDTMRPALLADLARRPVWLVGILGLIGGFLFQAAALRFAELTVVQPIVVSELPLTLLIAALVFRARLDREAVWGTVAVSAGVALVLIATDPRRGHPTGAFTWLLASVSTVAVVVSLVVAGLRASGSRRAALFGAAAGVGFGFTAALMKGAILGLRHGVGGLFSSWQLYAMVVVGIASVFLAQNALQAGPIVAAQPPITICDPLASVAYGVLVFGEHLRDGYWIIPTLTGAGIVILGTVLLSHSSLITVEASHDTGAATGPDDSSRLDQHHRRPAL